MIHDTPEGATPPVVALARQLIQIPSITPHDHGAQALIAERLVPLGFEVTHFNRGDVSNLWARKGHTGPVLAWVGHTDVVPPGESNAWQQPPFSGARWHGRVWGRGAKDMKGALAAMVCATERWAQQWGSKPMPCSVAFLITSDEEVGGPDGIAYAATQLAERDAIPHYALVGEPSSDQEVGDTVRVGRRGSLNGRLVFHGRAHHVAYANASDNTLAAVLPSLLRLQHQTWDTHASPDFPPTSFHWTQLIAGDGTTNVTPSDVTVQCNWRYPPSHTVDTLEALLRAGLAACPVPYTLQWLQSGAPFHTPSGPWLEGVAQAVGAITGRKPRRSTGGGTSDGRFLAPWGTQVVELGLTHDGIHQVDESVPEHELVTLTDVYVKVLEYAMSGAL